MGATKGKIIVSLFIYSMLGSFSLNSLKIYTDLVEGQLSLNYTEGGSYDFTRCVRPDGSAYGTGGKCRKGTQEAKLEKPKAEGKRGAKPGGMRITEKIKALGVEDLKKVLRDPRINDKQKEVLQKLLTVKEAEQTGEVKSKNVVKPKVIIEPPPKNAQTSGVSTQKIKEAFNKVSQAAVKAYELDSKYYKQGVAYSNPIRVGLSERLSSLKDKANTLRMAYHALDKTEFLRMSSEEATLMAKITKLRREKSNLMEKDGMDAWSTPPTNHPTVQITNSIKKLEEKARLVEEKKEAAYFGEPLSISRAKTDGGGQVSHSVPPLLPRGGASEALKDFLNGSEVVMAFPSKGFSAFVKQGEAKNGFEKGTQGMKKGRARAYLDGRMRGEAEVLGIPNGTPPKGRPVYAALEHPDRSRSLQGGGNLMSQYGGVQVVMNPSVKDRASFTFGDSLDNSRSEGVMASPVRDPSDPVRTITSKGKVEINMGGGTSSSRIRVGERLRDGEFASIPYMEAQIHGGLKLSDVKEVRYYRGHEIPEGTRKVLEKAGIKVTGLPPKLGDITTSWVGDPNFSNIDAIGFE